MDAKRPRSARQQRRAAARRSSKKATAQPARGLATALAALGAGLSAQPGVAATFTVNTPADGAPVADANLTLREAVQQANAAAGPDVIQFAAALSGQTITLDNAQGEIRIMDSVDIQGLGSAQLTVSGNDNQRIFYIYSPTPTTPITVSLSGLTLRDGASGLNNDGGAILSTNANLQITDSVLTENNAGEDGGAIAFKAFGDGDTRTVLNDALTLTRTTITLNTAATDGGGVSFYGGGEGTGPGGAEAYAGDLTIDASHIDQNTAAFYGGGLRVEDAHAVSVHDSFFDANTATDTADGRGGGVFVDDTNALEILRTEITNNTAGFDAGGLMLYNLYGSALVADGKISGNKALNGGGGGLELYDIDLGSVPGASVRIERTEIADNVAAGAGGGVYFYLTENADVLIEDSTISGNQAAAGGGLLSSVNLGTSVPQLSRTTVSANNAYYVGGGVAVTGFYTDGGSVPGALRVVDSTISGNDGGFEGGGIYDGSYGTLDLRHSTVVDNAAIYAGGGLFVGYEAPAPTVAHTILAGNDAFYGPDEFSSFGDGGSPTPVDLSWSILGDSTGASLNDIAGNQIDVAPALGPLQANGGPTETHKPLSGSPAINAGDPAVTGEPAVDQRSFARKVGVIDVGAVEVNPGTFELSISPTSVAEGGGPVVVTVSRLGGQDGAVSVELNFTNGSATNPADWNAPNAVVNFADNDTTPKVFNVAIVDDTTPEPDETFSAALANPTGGALLGVTTSGTVTIHDNDNFPVVEVPTLGDAGRALLIGLVAAAAVVLLRRRKGLGTALVFTIALTAGAAEAGSAGSHVAPAQNEPRARASLPLRNGAGDVHWRSHAVARKELVQVVAVDASSVTFRRANGALVRIDLARVRQEGAGSGQNRSLLRASAQVTMKLRLDAQGKVVKAKVSPPRPDKLRRH